MTEKILKLTNPNPNKHSTTKRSKGETGISDQTWSQAMNGKTAEKKSR